MQDPARPPRTIPARPSELASIVLGDTAARRHAPHAPERAPLPGAEGRSGGYDARSVLVLAIVVASLAGIVGWGMTLGRSERFERTAAPAGSEQRSDGAKRDAGAAARPTAPTSGAAVTAAAPGSTAAAVPERADLAPGRVTFTRSGSGGAILRVAVQNSGDAASAAGAGVLALLDGAVLTSGQLDAVASGGSSVVELQLDYCPAGRHALVVVVDATARVREVSEADNATSRSVVVDC